MRKARLLLAVMVALAVGACARQQPTYYVVAPNTAGQAVPRVTQQQLTQPQYMQQVQPNYQQPSPAQSNHGLYSSSPAYAQQAYGEPQYAQQTYVQPSDQRPTASGGRGLFTQGGPFAAQPQYAVPQGGPYVAAPNAYAPATPPSSGSGGFSR